MPIVLTYAVLPMIFFVSASASAEISLDQPFSALFREDTSDSHRLAKIPELIIDGETTLRQLIETSYFGNAFGRSRGTSLFAQVSLGEQVVREILAREALALDMTKSEIDLYERHPGHAAFRPLKSLDYRRYRGLHLQVAALQHSGLFLVRDLVRAFDRELTLPEKKRWRGVYERKFEEKVLRALSVIYRELSETTDVLSESARNACERFLDAEK